jgi:hypothetical protein
VRALELGQREFFGNDYSCDLFARDGTLCPHVIYPSKSLTSDQVSRLLRIASNPEFDIPVPGVGIMGRPRLRCGDAEAAAFVFLDDSESPVADVRVDEECAQWELNPAPEAGWEGLAGTTEPERAVLTHLCRELGMPSCGGTTTGQEKLRYRKTSDQPTHSELRLELRGLLKALLDDQPAIEEAKRLSNVSEAERSLLCAWSARAARIVGALHLSWSSVPSDSDTFTLVDSKTHKAIRLLGYADCTKEFPRCDKSVLEARRCLTRHLESFWNQEESCDTHCAWGIWMGPDTAVPK